MNVFQGILLILYAVAIFRAGRFAISILPYREYPSLLRESVSAVLGAMISVPLTYATAVMFAQGGNAVWIAVMLYTGLIFAVSLGLTVHRRQISGSRRTANTESRPGVTAIEWSLAVAMLCFSAWLMFKSFRGSADMWFVGSNEVFDFGHLLSIVRSFSWGDNLPYMSPFIAGTPDVYHFMFYFLAAILETFGMPLVWAVNLPSILAFWALLVVVYYLPQLLFRRRQPLLGAIAVLLTITHSTLTVFFLVRNYGLSARLLASVWHLAKYPFAGPFDGSVISIFTTLNVFVNQRHLALALAALFIVYLGAVHAVERTGYAGNRAVLLLGLFTGFMPLWHLHMYVITAAAVSVFLAIRKRWAGMVAYAAVSGAVGALWLAPWIAAAGAFMPSGTAAAGSQDLARGLYGFARFWTFNYGIGLATAALGFLWLSRDSRVRIAPLLVVYGLAWFGGPVFQADQKVLNVILISLTLLSAYAVTAVWRRGAAGRLTAAGLLILLTASGVTDLMVIKNDFAYPVADTATRNLIGWIHAKTDPNAVFISYPDIFDPVTLAGRRNFLGFYHNAYAVSREPAVRSAYETSRSADLAAVRTAGAAYMIVPLWNKSDFRYTPNVGYLRQELRTVFSDGRHIVFRL